jgi:hypothetical protein
LGDQGEGLEISKIRMFAMGKELKDDLFVYSYDIINESTVQVMIKNWANQSENKKKFYLILKLL